MPLLDVAELLTDPDFVDLQNVLICRRTVTVGDNGRAETTTEQIPVTASIQPGSSAALQRMAEYGKTGRAVTVHTQFRLRDTTDGLLPDLVLAPDNTLYIVDRVSDYSRYGIGFTSADCSAYEGTQNGADLGINHMMIGRAATSVG